MAYFACKLVPPRPTFPADMTPEEGALFGAHMAYWADLAAGGTAIVVGPVADPGGFWGLAVIEVADEIAARTVLARDPVTADRSGFKYELFPMPQATLREPRSAG